MNLHSQANDMAQTLFIPADLAPGDSKSADFDVATVEIVRVASRDDPFFEVAYARLWEQFGAAHEIETRTALGRRLAWDPARPRDGLAMRYDLLLLRDAAGGFVAARDHTGKRICSPDDGHRPWPERSGHVCPVHPIGCPRHLG